MAAPSLSLAPDPLEIARQRAVLFSARIQYGPETQPIRERAIDRLVEQDLLISDSESGQNVDQIYNHGVRNGLRIHRNDLGRSLERLKIAGRITECGVIKPISFRLAEPVAAELWTIQKASEQRIELVLRKLFETCPRGWKAYESSFTSCIATIFAELGETYARLLSGGVSKDEMLASPNISSAISKAILGDPSVDEGSLRNGVLHFFQDEDPEFGQLKFNLAQNYYIAKALGLDPNGTLLSREMLEGAEFYMDTNVLVTALAPHENNHTNFLALSRACLKLGVTLKFCQISLDELRNVVANQAQMIRRIDGRVSEECGQRIRDVFYVVYSHAKSAGGDIDSAFESFYNPVPILSSYAAERVDSEWFVKECALIDQDPIFQQVHKATAREKSNRVATHDALLLKWVHLQRESVSQKTWVLTRDRSLPKILTQSGRIAVTLDALLQWIAPVAGEEAAQSFAAIFADTLRHQLLPQENFLDVHDLGMLLDMGLTCETLPVEDVAGCIRHLKAFAPGLDPTNPSDREHLHRHISRFFADPGRQYQTNLAKLKAVKDSEIGQLKLEGAAKERELDELRSQLGSQGRADAERIEALNVELQKRDRQVALDRLCRSGRRRIAACSVAVAIIEIVFCWMAYDPTQGSLMRQISAVWAVLAGLGALLIAASAFVVGKERLQALGLNISKFFGNPSPTS